MSFEVTLDDIKAAAEKKYGNLIVPLDESTKVVLRNPLRLSKDERAAIEVLQKQMNEEDESKRVDQEDGLAEMLLLVADNRYTARRLLDSFEGDLTQLVALFQMYQDRTQLGEASPSQD